MHTISVTNLNDSGTGSLRQALTDASSYTSNDEVEIVFDMSLAGTISLGNDLKIPAKVTVQLPESVKLNLNSRDLLIYGNLTADNESAVDSIFSTSPYADVIVYSGGKMSLTKANIALPSSPSVQINEGGTVELAECEIDKGVQNAGDLKADNCTFNSYVEYDMSTGSLSGNGNTFAADETLRLRNVSGDPVDLLDFIGEVTENAYIGLSGSMYDCTLADVSSVVPQGYKLSLNTTVQSGYTVTLEEGVRLNLGSYDLSVYGNLIADNQSSVDSIFSTSTSARVIVYSGGKMSLTKANIALPTSSPYKSVRINEGGTVELAECEIDKVVHNSGNLKADNCTFNSYVEYDMSTGSLSGNGNTFAADETLRLTNDVSGDTVDLLDFIGEVTENAYIGLSGSVYIGYMYDCTLADVVPQGYKLLINTRVQSGYTVTLEEGVRLNLGSYDLSVYGNLIADNQSSVDSIFSTSTSAQVIVFSGGKMSLTKANIALPASQSVQINEGGTVELAECDIDGDVKNAGDLKANNCTFKSYVTNNGSLQADNCTFNSYVEYDMSTGSLSGNGNTFAADETLRLTNVSGNPVDLLDFIGEVTENAYITLSGPMYDCTLADISSKCAGGYCITGAVYGNVEVESGVSIEELSYLGVYGTFKVENQTVHDAINPEGRMGYVTIHAGGRGILKNSNVSLNSIDVDSGGVFDMTGGALNALLEVSEGAEAHLDSVHCKWAVDVEGSLTADSCVFEEEINLHSGAVLSGSGNIFANEEVYKVNEADGDVAASVPQLKDSQYAKDDPYISIVSFAEGCNVTLNTLTGGLKKYVIQKYYSDMPHIDASSVLNIGSGAVVEAIEMECEGTINCSVGAVFDTSGLILKGTLNCDRRLFDGQLALGAGALLCGNGNTIAADMRFVLSDWSGEVADAFAGLSDTVLEDGMPAIHVQSVSGSAIFGRIYNQDTTYVMEDSYLDGDLVIQDGVTLRCAVGDTYVYGNLALSGAVKIETSEGWVTDYYDGGGSTRRGLYISDGAVLTYDTLVVDGTLVLNEGAAVSGRNLVFMGKESLGIVVTDWDGSASDIMANLGKVETTRDDARLLYRIDGLGGNSVTISKKSQQSLTGDIFESVLFDEVVLYEGDILTIGADAPVTVGSLLQVQEGATLNLQSGARLKVEQEPISSDDYYYVGTGAVVGIQVCENSTLLLGGKVYIDSDLHIWPGAEIIGEEIVICGDGRIVLHDWSGSTAQLEDIFSCKVSYEDGIVHPIELKSDRDTSGTLISLEKVLGNHVEYCLGDGVVYNSLSLGENLILNVDQASYVDGGITMKAGSRISARTEEASIRFSEDIAGYDCDIDCTLIMSGGARLSGTNIRLNAERAIEYNYYGEEAELGMDYEAIFGGADYECTHENAYAVCYLSSMGQFSATESGADDMEPEYMYTFELSHDFVNAHTPNGCNMLVFEGGSQRTHVLVDAGLTWYVGEMWWDESRIEFGKDCHVIGQDGEDPAALCVMWGGEIIANDTTFDVTLEIDNTTRLGGTGYKFAARNAVNYHLDMLENSIESVSKVLDGVDYAVLREDACFALTLENMSGDLYLTQDVLNTALPTGFTKGVLGGLGAYGASCVIDGVEIMEGAGLYGAQGDFSLINTTLGEDVWIDCMGVKNYVMDNVMFDGGIVYLDAENSHISQCSGRGTLEIGGAAVITNCDLSQMSICFSSSMENGGVVDLSGNYWGTTDIEEIRARYTTAATGLIVKIDHILTEKPIGNFEFSELDLHNNLLNKGASEFSVIFSSVVDASSITEQSIQLVDAYGNKVPVELVSVQGNTVKLRVGEVPHDSRLRILLSADIKSADGESIKLPEGGKHVAEIRTDYQGPQVSRVFPGGDFTGTLDAFKIYFTEAVDTVSLKENLTLTNPDGSGVAIKSVRNLGGNVYEISIDSQNTYGTYELTVASGVVDKAGNALNQNNNDIFGEADDVYRTSFSMADVDLRVADVKVDSSLNLGNTTVVSWTGYNADGYALQGTWEDGVYLSADAVWDINDQLLGEYKHSGGLAEGSTYTGSVQISPQGAQPGNYYVLVRPDIKGEGYSSDGLHYIAVPVSVEVSTLSVGESISGSLHRGDSQEVYMLQQVTGQDLKLLFTSDDSLAKMEIFIGYGRVPTRESYDMAWQYGESSGEILLPAVENNQELYILVNNKSTSRNVSFELTAMNIPLAISGITPAAQAQNATSTFDILGVGFTADTKVVLIDTDGQQYIPDSLEVIDGTRIRIKYEALSLPADKLDVLVEKDGETAELEDVVSITPAGGAHLQIYQNYPVILGHHLIANLNIQYENTGTDAMYAPLLTLTGYCNDKTGAIMTMEQSIVQNGFWTDAMPEGFANSVSFLAYSPGTPGWLMPSGKDVAMLQNDANSSLTSNVESTEVYKGENYRVSILNNPKLFLSGEASQILAAGASASDLSNTATIYYCGWEKPWDANSLSVSFKLHFLGTDNKEPLNWSDMFDSMDMPDEQKTLMTAALARSAGDTWGDYVLMLNKNLIYLSELGCVSTSANTMFDTNALVQFEIAKAAGSMTPTSVLASSTDMAVPSTGMGLGISRVYANNLSSRYKEGAFGHGWTFNWDVYLSFRDDGSVEYHAGGATYVYQPSYQGGYIAASGDHSTFSKERDGSYTLKSREGSTSYFSADGLLQRVADANGNTISCTYSGDGKLVKLIHSNGEFISIEWGSNGYITRLTNTQGDEVVYDYANGNLIKATDRFGESVQYEYSEQFSHALTQVVGKNGESICYSYNSAGLLQETAATSDDGNMSGYGKVTLTYGDNGEVTVTDIYGATTTYFYDNNGHVRKAIDVNGNTLLYGYDDKGNQIWFTDQAGNTSSCTYDEYGNLKSSTNALGYTTRYTYTSQNNVNILLDANGNMTDYDYDKAGNLISITYADGTRETWTYDAVGNADSWTNRRGKTVLSEYDLSGRVTLRQYEDGSMERFAYDERGNLLSCSDATGTTTYSYDERFRLTSIQFPDGRSLSYTYDAADRRASMVDELGNETRYSYDGFGNLTRVTDGAGNLLVEYSYDLGGRLTVEEKGDGTQTLYSYNKNGAVLQMDTLNAEGEVVSFCHYAYDKVGMRTAMTTQDGLWDYSYDKIGQLIGAVFTPATGSSHAAQKLEYEYDAVGNRTRSVVNGVETLYTVNNMNQTTTAGDTTYTYDADGNMTSKTDADGTTLYTWDDNNRLIRVQTATGDVYEYTYNVAGDRVAVTENGKATQYVYDPSGYGNLVAEYDGESGQQNKTYTHGNGLIGFEDAMSGEYFWYQGDALGSVTGITDASGNLVATYAYDPFGSVIGCTGDIENPYQWTGLWGLSQEASGLTHMRARYYDAETGKFISADPIGVNGGVNLYAYCFNNGVMAMDPSGCAGYMNGEFFLHNAVGGLLGIGALVVGTTVGAPSVAIIGAGVAIMCGGLSAIELVRGGLNWSLDQLLYGGDGRWLNPVIDAPWHNWDYPSGVSILEQPAYADDLGKWLAEHQELDEKDSSLTNPFDPNDLLGPSGYGEQNFIAPGKEMSFMIRFENEEDATAPTHWMRVFSTLDESYDLDSFTLNSFYVAGNLVELTAGQDSFNNKVTMTVDARRYWWM